MQDFKHVAVVPEVHKRIKWAAMEKDKTMANFTEFLIDEFDKAEALKEKALKEKEGK